MQIYNISLFSFTTSSAVFVPPLFVDIYRYIAGTINMVSIVETSIPPITAVPIAIRPLAPSALANANGISPVW